MLLAIDAGNTNITFAVCHNGKFARTWRCKTDSGRMADEYAVLMSQFFAMADLSFTDITSVIVSSVVPDVNAQLRIFFTQNFKCHPHFVTHEDTNGNLSIGLDKPDEIGADRLVNALAAVHDYQAPAVVIDFGTATTFDVVNDKNTYIGGVIAPGVNLSLNSLHAAAAKLPKVSVKKPQSVIGTGTTHAMQSGIYWGYIGLIEGTLGRITTELGTKPYVIATGGLSGLFSEGTQMIDTVDEDLTLKGLLYIYERQQRAKAA